MITVERSFPSGAWIVSALVVDNDPDGNPWGSPFYERLTFMGYSKREAVERYREAIHRRGLSLVAV